MQASNPYTPSSAPVASTTPRPAPGRRIVDAPTRTFHALFALCFAGAYLGGDSEAWRILLIGDYPNDPIVLRSVDEAFKIRASPGNKDYNSKIGRHTG